MDKSSKDSDESKNTSPVKPVATFRYGQVNVSVFISDRKTKSGQTFESHNIVLDRSYFSPNENRFKRTNTLQPSDVMAATIALQKAFEFVEERKASDSE